MKTNERINPDSLKKNGINIDKNVSADSHGGNKGFDAGSRNEKAAEFEKLIEGEFKNEFTLRVKKIIERRLREVKNMKEQNEKNAEIVSLIKKRFNIEGDNYEDFERVIGTHKEIPQETKTIENEKSQEVNPRVIALIRHLMAENAMLKEKREKSFREEQYRSRASVLKKQVEETEKAYEDFDFDAQLENEEFCRLLKAGVSVKSAYEVTNMQDILDKNSKSTEKNVVDSIRSKKRPVENGADMGSGILMERGVKNLTKKERAALASRASKGETIKF